MNREIKFRYVVKKRDGDIITCILSLTEIQKRTGEWLVFDSVLDKIGLENYEIIDRQQFIGLLDKNNKEIYEGDIISWEYEYDSDYDGDMPIVKTSKGKKVVMDIFDRTKIFDAKSEGSGVEIIGNIHETPNLLQK